jgi:hypothetical protein
MMDGPWFVDGRPLVLKQWKPGAEVKEKDTYLVPKWVVFPQLPLQFWRKSILNKLASAMGIPMYTDAMTAKKAGVEYARMLVEVDIREDLLYEILIMGKDGAIWKQSIDYEWYPTYCKNCKAFTHITEKCSRKPEQVWVEKP